MATLAVTVTVFIVEVVAALITEMTRHKYMQNRDSIEQEIKTRKELLASGNQEAIIKFARECRMK